ncbi:MAG: hypothetical protein LUQ54_05065 [Methanoregula sp.]|nr:hypothetical protein [Methanoregula sp.]
MQETDFRGSSPVLEKNLKIAVEQTCELCREYYPLSMLEIHLISRRRYKEMVRDPSTRFLVVCQSCHNHIHQLPVPAGKQRALVKSRSFFIRRDLRRILGYTPKPYTPPDDINIPLIYEEYVGRHSWGSYRLSG